MVIMSKRKKLVLDKQQVKKITGDDLDDVRGGVLRIVTGNNCNGGGGGGSYQGTTGTMTLGCPSTVVLPSSGQVNPTIGGGGG
jgi:hypothetical protein